MCLKEDQKFQLFAWMAHLSHKDVGASHATNIGKFHSRRIYFNECDASLKFLTQLDEIYYHILFDTNLIEKLNRFAFPKMVSRNFWKLYSHRQMSFFSFSSLFRFSLNTGFLFHGKLKKKNHKLVALWSYLILDVWPVRWVLLFVCFIKTHFLQYSINLLCVPHFVHAANKYCWLVALARCP